MDHIALVLEHLSKIELLILLPLAVLGGMVIGAIPGLTSTMAVGVLLPFTLFLDPLTGVLILVGIGKGSLFGGSISAILMNVPGTAGRGLHRDRRLSAGAKGTGRPGDRDGALGVPSSAT